MENHSEATIQAELYHQCRCRGLAVVLELSTAVGRLDLAIMTPTGNALAAVEVKKMKPVYETKQMRRYRTLGLPLFELWRMADCESMAEQLAKIGGDGISVERLKAAKLPEGHPLKRPSKMDRLRARIMRWDA
jgi:hypothetical protein